MDGARGLALLRAGGREPVRPQLPGAELGADIAIASDLPRAAGLSSSSALVVAVASVLARRAALDAREEWRRDISSPAELAWYLGCVENGLGYRGLAGTSGVGTHGGSEDHTAILTSRPGCVSQHRFMPVVHEGDVPMPEGWTFVVGSSGVHADKAGAVKARLIAPPRRPRAPRPLEPRGRRPRALARHGARGARCPRLPARPYRRRRPRDLPPRRARAPACALRRREPARARRGPCLRRDRRRDARLAGRRVAARGRRVAGQPGAGNPRAGRARAAHGALAASSFGAGFGGSVWAIVDREDAARFVRRWKASYLRAYPDAQAADWFLARPGPALTEL
ncbi:MAG: hypothetical protein R2712_13855 [Vicinamibacterales bacterium]